MKSIMIRIAVTLTLVTVFGCRNTTENITGKSHPGLPVTVTSVNKGRMTSRIELSATSQYMYKAIIKAPVTGYIETIEINPGDVVDKNKTLFTIRTREASALRDDSVKNLKFSGVVGVKTSIAGIISSAGHPAGDYVSEGDELCQVAVPESFVFILDVPFELSHFVTINKSCDLMLPDSTVLKGVIGSRLPVMAGSSQTENFIVRLTRSRKLPENLSAKVRLVKDDIENAVSLSKVSILTDETMENFWVMKLINDSMAVKIPVKTGITQGAYVQILQPGFDQGDKFLSSGNFGLGDTAYVKVINSSANE